MPTPTPPPVQLRRSHLSIARRDPAERDVHIEILYCGICHSDLHTVRDEWKSVMPTVYPCVPGHEIVGRVTRVGSAVTKFKTGDRLCRLLGRLRSHVRRLSARPRAILSEPDAYLQFAGHAPWRRHLGAIPTRSSWMNVLFSVSFTARSRRRGALLCAGITTFAHAPLGRHQRQESRVVGLGGWATWR